MMRIFLCLMLILVSCAVSSAKTGDAFAVGVAAAQAGDFSAASAAFQESLRGQPSVGGFLNLGLVEWQAGHAGAAILAWERAAWIDPSDRRVGNNLKLARAVAQVEGPELRWFETISLLLPARAWVWLAAASLWVAIGMLVLPRVLRWRKSTWQQSAVALGLGIFIFSLTANFGVASRANLGVVTQKNASLRLTPTRGGEITTPLAPGETFRVLRARGDYFFIQTSLATGWVERSRVGRVAE